MSIYSFLLIEENQYPDALEVIEEYQLRYGYEIGLGIRESMLFEKLGMLNEGILAAFKDLEYRKFYGLLSSHELMNRLGLLEKKLSNRSWNPEGEGKEILKGLKAYVLGQWEEGERFLASADLDSEIPYYRFLCLSLELERGKAADGAFEDYLKLEEHFRNFPGYYYHFWRGMKKGGGNYNIGTVRNLLEKCILLCPDTEYAAETREELGMLIGLRPEEGKKILLGPELDKIYERLLGGADPGILEPVMDLLSIPDNVYGLAAVLMLKKAQRIPVIRTYLETGKDKAQGRLAERLAGIVEN